MFGTMGRCELIKFSGLKCGSNFKINQIFLKDGHGAFEGMKNICQIDSQEVFGKLRQKENSIKEKIRRIENLVYNKKDFSYQTEEMRINTKDDREKLKNLRKILQDFRNHYCRICDHPLTCVCEQCRNRHSGTVISSATLFSIYGYRRDTFNFHIVCGRIFFNRFGIQLMPQSTGQETLV